MKLDGAWINAPETQAVMAMLTGADHQALFVGGCVRNAALAQPVSDIDIATDAPPETVIQLARSAGFKPVPTGLDHGTVTVIARHIPHEITTFRRDVETDGRHAVVAYSTDIAEDAARRDFTMNALYARADGTVIDPLGQGLNDLAARHVRFVGTPSARITEDFLRILRFFRFTAWYGDPDHGPDASGLAACAAHADGLEGLARERIGAEMLKLLGAPDPAPVLATMQQCGVLARILPGADSRAMAPLVHFEAGLPANPLRRLACLTATPATAMLRLSRAQAKRLARIQTGVASLGPPAEIGYRLGQADAVDAVLIRAASLGMPPPQHWHAEVARGAAQKCPVTAQDLLPDYQGKDLGARLKVLEDRWIASDFKLSRAALLR
ncbi:CCA tRNA nucleotidyltransferase [Rhodobacteraceae bacterium]|nr:CCA tRNA nucleotidyltransferase [Paracoccaceae bacterium]